MWTMSSGGVVLFRYELGLVMRSWRVKSGLVQRSLRIYGGLITSFMKRISAIHLLSKQSINMVLNCNS